MDLTNLLLSLEEAMDLTYLLLSLKEVSDELDLFAIVIERGKR